jgi:hypothetical protein
MKCMWVCSQSHSGEGQAVGSRGRGTVHSGNFLNTLKAINLSENPLLYDFCHLREIYENGFLS